MAVAWNETALDSLRNEPSKKREKVVVAFTDIYNTIAQNRVIQTCVYYVVMRKCISFPFLPLNGTS